MKVLLINGSPHVKGCTYTALDEIAKTLKEEGIESEIFHIGNDAIRGCIGCGMCYKEKNGKCTFDTDSVNVAIDKMEECDAMIVGSPVHYAAASGAVTAFLDRLFYAGSKKFALKPAAAVVSCRRGGASAAFDQLNKYFTIANMPVISSQYWNMVHGSCAEDVLQDLEGLQTMRTLGKNMAWMLKCIEAGKKNGVTAPERERVVRTNFIR